MRPYSFTIRHLRWLIPLVVLVIVPAGYLFSLDWRARPLCHSQFYIGCQNWLDANKTNAFPNVDGQSAASLAELRDCLDEAWPQNYKYVPGLRENDPGDLVLAYFTEPTRWTWHGLSGASTVFTEKQWLIVPIDFARSPSRPVTSHEWAERVPEDELRTRLKRTLDFLRENDRPNWQAAVAEHTKFLD